MRPVLRSFVPCVIVAAIWAAGIVQAAEPQYRPDVVIVKLKPQAANTAKRSSGSMATGVRSLDQLNLQFNVRDFKTVIPAAAPVKSDVYGLGNYYFVDLPPGSDVPKAIAAYAADPNVEVAEPDYIEPLDMVPNDPDYNLQWTYHNGVDEDCDTQEGWDLEVGDSTVLVGIIDSGIKYTHPDLKAEVWVNPGEDLNHNGVPFDSSDINGIDDDGDGYVDDLIGYDFLPAMGGCAAGEDCNGPDNNPDDVLGHGTNCNGIAGACTGNLTGGAGMAGGDRSARRPGVKLMGLRAGWERADGNGFVDMGACATACNYAVNRGVSVISCSWGSSGTLIRTAILNAVAHGVVVCKAAGNDTSIVPDILDSTFGVLSVAALTSSGGHAAFTNYGTWVKISAPGDNIYNTYTSPPYAYLSGTSMASPTVAGVAALLKSHHPWFTKTQIDTLLMNHADNINAENPGYAGLLGAGRVNAYWSLAALTTADFSVDTTFGRVPFTVNFTNTSPNAPSGPYTYDFGDGNTGPGPNASHTYNTPGLMSIKFTGSGPSGPHTRIRPEMIVAVQDTIKYGDIVVTIGQDGAVPIRLHNTHPINDVSLPFVLTGTPNVSLDSLTLSPLTAKWNIQLANDAGGQQKAYRLKALTAGAPVPAGGGIIAYAWVSADGGSSGAVETLDSATLGSGQATVRLISNWANFKPDFVKGTVTLFSPCDCHCHGDPACDGSIDILDVVAVINVAFRGAVDVHDPSCTLSGRSDINCDCSVDVLDVVTVINHAFRGDNSALCNACTATCP
jgi:subtilisin family serine protease